MKPKLTKQEAKVHSYILNHRGCTTHDIQRDTFIECPSARITALRHKGIKIISIGKKRYPDSRPFEMYAIENELPTPKPTYTYDPTRNVMVESI
jgi:Helix-turn-helix domain